jgi:glycosyltransferase involved in cell wall biosynthesis
LYDSALSVKPWKKIPFLKLFRFLRIHKKVLFHATNEREEQAIRRFFPGSTILVADNLPNSNQPPFQTCAKEPGTVKCVFIARIVHIKNLLFLLKALENIRETVILTIVGPAEDKVYWHACRQEMERLKPNIRVDYLGPKRNDELTAILQAHHLFVLPTTGENFGHSIFEALLTGRPVLISDQTPWLGLAGKKAGWDLPLEDPAAFARIIEQVAGWNQYRFDEWAAAAWQYAQNFIANPALKNGYLKLFT